VHDRYFHLGGRQVRKCLAFEIQGLNLLSGNSSSGFSPLHLQ
jgi:hypothetical protein